MGVGPTSSAWEANALTDMLYLQNDELESRPVQKKYPTITPFINAIRITYSDIPQVLQTILQSSVLFLFSISIALILYHRA